jgi:hypothetical protein
MDITTLQAILALAEKYGLSIVLLIGLIVLNIYLFKWIGSKFDMLFKQVVEVKAPDPVGDNVEYLINIDAKIRGCLSAMMADMHCQWAQLWQFHNGLYSIGKPRIPFMFISLTHECVQINEPPMYTEFHQLPLSLFGTFSNELVSGELIIHDYEKGNNIEQFGGVLAQYGAKSCLIRTVRDESNNIIGFMTAAYITKALESEATKTAFLNFAQQMTAILSSVRSEKANK